MAAPVSSTALNYRRLIVCFDGTSNDGNAFGKHQTNVGRLYSCITPYDTVYKVEQLKYYVQGLGTTSSLSIFSEGALGANILEKAMKGYKWLCKNWQSPNDEIFLTGFSRGAFTARVLILLLKDIGLLDKDSLDRKTLEEIRNKWKAQADRLWNTYTVDQRDKMMEALQDKLREKGKICHSNIRVKACALWDSVRSTHFGRGSELRHVDMAVCDNIDYAFQALALNERRGVFKPKLWHKVPGQTLRQCWFLGHHSDVGGGNRNLRPANLSLIWMVEQLNDLLFIDEKQLVYLTSGGVLSSSPPNMPQQLILEDSLTSGWRVFGIDERKPGVNQQEEWSALDMNSPTEETVHWSVNWLVNRAQPIQRVTGYSYFALSDFAYVRDEIYWQRRDGQVRLPENLLSSFELRVLRKSQNIDEDSPEMRFAENDQPGDTLMTEGEMMNHRPLHSHTPAQAVTPMAPEQTEGKLESFPQPSLYLPPQLPPPVPEHSTQPYPARPYSNRSHSTESSPTQYFSTQSYPAQSNPLWEPVDHYLQAYYQGIPLYQRFQAKESCYDLSNGLKMQTNRALFGSPRIVVFQEPATEWQTALQAWQDKYPDKKLYQRYLPREASVEFSNGVKIRASDGSMIKGPNTPSMNDPATEEHPASDEWKARYPEVKNLTVRWVKEDDCWLFSNGVKIPRP